MITEVLHLGTPLHRLGQVPLHLTAVAARRLVDVREKSTFKKQTKKTQSTWARKTCKPLDCVLMLRWEIDTMVQNVNSNEVIIIGRVFFFFYEKTRDVINT